MWDVGKVDRDGMAVGWEWLACMADMSEIAK